MRIKNGFTLMELLVAIAILSIISISCYVAFDAALKSWRKSEARVERYQNARGALEMMARELQEAFILTANSTYSLIGTATTLYFTTSKEASKNVYEIGYAIRTSDNILLKQVDTTPDNDVSASGDTNNTSELAQNIIGLVFNYGYYSDSVRNTWRWTSTWDTISDPISLPVLIDGLYENYSKSGTAKKPDGLPEAIRISLAVRDEKSYEAIQSFYTVMYLPNAE